MLHNCLAKINRMDLNSLKRNQNDIVEVTILYAASVDFFCNVLDGYGHCMD